MIHQLIDNLLMHTITLSIISVASIFILLLSIDLNIGRLLVYHRDIGELTHCNFGYNESYDSNQCYKLSLTLDRFKPHKMYLRKYKNNTCDKIKINKHKHCDRNDTDISCFVQNNKANLTLKVDVHHDQFNINSSFCTKKMCEEIMLNARKNNIDVSVNMLVCENEKCKNITVTEKTNSTFVTVDICNDSCTTQTFDKQNDTRVHIKKYNNTEELIVKYNDNAHIIIKHTTKHIYFPYLTLLFIYLVIGIFICVAIYGMC